MRRLLFDNLEVAVSQKRHFACGAEWQGPLSICLSLPPESRLLHPPPRILARNRGSKLAAFCAPHVQGGAGGPGIFVSGGVQK
jgi:hypothetical protein